MSFLFSYLRQRRPNIVDYEFLPIYVIGLVESDDYTGNLELSCAIHCLLVIELLWYSESH